MLIKLSTWSCLEIRMEDEVTIQRLTITPLNAWNSSDIGNNLTNRNCIQEEIKNSLKSGNAPSPSVQNRLFSGLLSNNIKIKRYRTLILSVVL